MTRVGFCLRSTGIAIASIAMLAGCALIERNETIHTERMLAAAGFQMKVADTPEKLAHLQSLTQQKLVRHERDGQAFYVYADALDCKCLYVGDEHALREYQMRIYQRTEAQEEALVPLQSADVPMDWDVWRE